MERTFNMGIGMVAVVPEASVDATLATLSDRGLPAWVCGLVRDRRDGEEGDAAAKGGSGGAVTVTGDHREG
jgi:phosphoribosylformylglycinamidine cyclo-ligase